MAKKRKSAQVSSATSQEKKEPLIRLSEEEQWKIIKETGILNKITTNPENEKAEVAGSDSEPLLSPLTEEIFSSMTLIIPHSFLLLMMEILVHYQYGRRPTYQALFDRMIAGVPILCIFIFYTCRYKTTRPVRSLLFFLALGCGSRLIWIINFANWRRVMKLAPPLATAWIYCIVQLDVGPATLSLMLLAAWVYYKNLRIVFN